MLPKFSMNPFDGIALEVKMWGLDEDVVLEERLQSYRHKLT